jgi:6-phosphofructokinase 1
VSDAATGKVLLRGNAIIAQGGGPTAVINRTLVGAIRQMVRSSEIDGIYGAWHGIEGILGERLVDLRATTPRSLERVGKTPSAALGSVRRKPTVEDCHRVFEVCQKHKVRYFFYVGGNDSAEAAHIIATEAQDASYDMRVYHIPKTIDNDLLENDHCPGYGSAARFVAQALVGDQLDNRALPGIKVNVTMGRDAGFLAAASVLGHQRSDDGPHLVYIPERAFDMQRFVNDVRDVHSELGRCVVVASEGIRLADGTLVKDTAARLLPAHGAGPDGFNNAQLSGTGVLGDLLASEIKKHLGEKLRVRADTFGYLQRCFPEVVSKTDGDEAEAVGREAVKSATLDERPNASVVIRRHGTAKTYLVAYELADLEKVAGGARSMPDEFISAEGNNVTEAFRDYALPLVGRLPRFAWFKDIPVKSLIGK